jgi:Protein of unknown function (DUF998)
LPESTRNQIVAAVLVHRALTWLLPNPARRRVLGVLPDRRELAPRPPARAVAPGRLRPVDRRRLGQGLVIAAAGVVVALHLLRPDLDPMSHRLSDYANGPHGWLMAVVFGVTAAAALVLAPIIASSGRTAGRRRAIGVALVVAAIGLAAAGAFRTGVREAGALSDQLHGLTSSVAAIALVVAATASGRRAIAVPAGVVLATSPLLHRTAVAGLDQRVLWALVLVWLLTSAPRPDRVSAPSAASRTMGP